MESLNKYVSGRKSVILQTLSIRKLFLASIIIGGLLIFASVFWANAFFSMLFPVVVMAIYIAITFYKDMDLPKTLIGDSYYYLGFIFTLLALVASLLTLGDGEVSIGAVVGSFGAALLTTIIGLIARLIITTFSTESADRRERLEQEIERSLDRFTSQVEVMTSKVIASVTKISSETDASMNKTLDFQKETQERFTDVLENVSSSFELSIRRVNAKLEGIEINPEIISSSVASSFEIISAKLTKVLEDQEKLNGALKTGLSHVEGFSDSAERAVSSHLTQSSDALSELMSKQAEQYSQSLGEISNSILMSFGDVKDIKSSLEEEWRLRLEALNNETDGIAQTVQSTNVVLEQMKANVSDIASVSMAAQESLKSQVHLISEDNGISDIMVSLKELAQSTTKSSSVILEVVGELRKSQHQLSISLGSVDQTVDEVSNAAKIVNEDLSKVYRELTDQISKISKQDG